MKAKALLLPLIPYPRFSMKQRLFALLFLFIPLAAIAFPIEGEIQAPVQAEASIAAAWVELPGPENEQPVDPTKLSLTVWPDQPGKADPMPSRLQSTEKGYQILWRVPKGDNADPMGDIRRFTFRIDAGDGASTLTETSPNLIGNGKFTELDAKQLPVGIKNFANMKLVKLEDGNAIAFKPSPDGSPVRYQTPPFAVSEKESYHISFRYRIEGAKPQSGSGSHTASSFLHFFDRNRKRVLKQRVLVSWDTSTGGWKTVDLTLTAPPKATSAYFQFANVSEEPYSVMIADVCIAPTLLGSARLTSSSDIANTAAIFRFNFGTGKAAAWNRFVPAPPNQKYSPKKGWGFTRIEAPRAIDNLRPDPLTRDFITAAPADFRVDLPNGKYHVWILTGDKSSGEKYQRFYFDQFLSVNGKTLHQFNPKPSEYIMQRVLQHYSDFWVPGMDYYDTFIRTGFTEFKSEAEVSDGHLMVEWRNLPVSAMMLYPAENAHDMDREIAEIAKNRHRDTSIAEVPAPQENPPIEPTKEELSRGFVLYRQSSDKAIYPTTSPSAQERITHLEAFATPGETESAWFSLHALKDLDPVSIKVEDLHNGTERVPASALDVRVAGYIFANAPSFPSQGAGYKYQVIAGPLDKRDDLPVVKGHNWSWRVDLQIPRTTPPGIYRGSLKIVTAKNELVSLPLQVRVLPFTLAPLPIVQGYYYAPSEPWRSNFREVGSSVVGTRASDDPALLDIAIANERREFEFMKSIGLNSASFGYDINRDLIYRDGEVFLRHDEGKFQNDFSLWMDLYTKAGMGPMPLYIFQGIGRVGRGPIDGQKNRLSSLDPSLNPAFTEHWFNVYRSLVANVQKEAQEKKWPEILWYISDEVKDAVDLSVKAAQTLADMPGVRTISSTNSPQEKQLISHVDIIMPNFAFPITEEVVSEIKPSKTELWVYNCGQQRLTLGLWSWKMEAKGRFQWHYRYPAAEPWDDPGGGGQAKYCISYQGPDGPIPTVHSDILRAAITDHRYLATLEKLVAEHKNNPTFSRQVKAAENFMNDLRERLPVDIRALIGWRVDPRETGGALGGEYRNNDALQRVRWATAQLILDFQP